MKTTRRSIRAVPILIPLTAALGILLLAAGCGRPTSIPAPVDGPSLATLEPSPPPEQVPQLDCQEDFVKRELDEPYQRGDGNQPRYTLSAEELKAYLGLMGIESLCLPDAFGAPFLNVDWNEADLPIRGRMVSLGFEGLYSGGGWSSAYLIYASYDFEIGSEYETFASPADFQALQSGTLAPDLQAGSTPGFVRYHTGLPMGGQAIMKTYVFPFEDHYVAAVVNLGFYEPDQVESILAEMETGVHPDLRQEIVQQMDGLVGSLVFGSEGE